MARPDAPALDEPLPGGGAATAVRPDAGAPGTAALLFGIPVKSRVVAKDWGMVCRLLSRTVASVLNQSVPGFRIVIAHHELPEIPYGGDPRIEFLRADFPPPLYRQEMMVDKNRKREMIAHRLRQMGGGYLMYLDADDLVSGRLAEFVLADRHAHGYVVNRGYELDHRSQTVRVAPSFDRLCGSCCILRWDVEDLPETPFAPARVRLRNYLDAGHARWAALAASEGRPLKAVPFPAVVYVTNTGENHSVVTGNIGWRRRLLRRVTPRRRIDSALRAEFAIPPPA